MPNMQPKKVPIKEQDPFERARNWGEVALGYTEEEAKLEALRCLNCKHRPCVSGCPVNIKIPDFLLETAKGNFKRAYEIIKQTNSLPAVCGRVCPQESQCESKCVRGIKGEPVAIGRLERFVADWVAKNEAEEKEKKNEENTEKIKVALIGSGPASLACAGDLLKYGYDVTIFEALHEAGGVLVYGIPEFRLPKKIVKDEIESLKAQGAKIQLNTVIGSTLTIEDLFEMGFEAVFIGSGAGLPNFLNIPGENSNGVYSANEFLTRINLMKAYREEYATPVKKSKRVAVVGGGNVAMDAARCAKRLGAEVHIVYRRSESEMPARLEEVHHAKEEGIIFDVLTNPKRINADEKGNVISMTCSKMELGEPDASGRRKPVEIPNSEFDLEVDTVIMAIGTSPNPLITNTTAGLEKNKHGCIVTSDGVTTTKEGVFAGGDAVTGAATVILAMGAGKEAAKKIDEYIKSKHNIG